MGWVTGFEPATSGATVMALEQNARLVMLSRLYRKRGQRDPAAGTTMMAWSWFVVAPAIVPRGIP